MIINERVIFFQFLFFPLLVSSWQSKQVMLSLRLEMSFQLSGFEPLSAQPEGFSVQRVSRARLRRECQPGYLFGTDAPRVKQVHQSQAAAESTGLGISFPEAVGRAGGGVLPPPSLLAHQAGCGLWQWPQEAQSCGRRSCPTQQPGKHPSAPRKGQSIDSICLYRRGVTGSSPTVLEAVMWV